MTTASKGGRPATGSIKWRRNPKTEKPQWFVRLTLADGSRPFVALDPSIPREDEGRARESARTVADEARRTGLVPDVAKETTREWFRRLHAHKEKLGLATVKEMRGRARSGSYPASDTRPGGVTREDIEAIVLRLDRAVRAFIEARARRRCGSRPRRPRTCGATSRTRSTRRCGRRNQSLRVLTRTLRRDVRGPETPATIARGRSSTATSSSHCCAASPATPTASAGSTCPFTGGMSTRWPSTPRRAAANWKHSPPPTSTWRTATIEIAKQADRTSKGRARTKRTKTQACAPSTSSRTSAR